MRVWLTLATLTVPLAACQFIPGTDAAKIRTAEKNLLYDIADADSAKFRNERVERLGRSTGFLVAGKLVKFDDPYFVCGEVNAKNGFGAYIGFTPFAYDPQRERALIYPSALTSNEDAPTVLDFPEECRPAPSEAEQLLANQTRDDEASLRNAARAANTSAPALQ